MKTITYRLPAHWASAFFNGDLTGLDDDDAAAFERVVDGESLPDPLAIAEDDPEFGPESFFCKYHDARPYGVLACDCYDYVFPA
jgi:hypothetical protein